MRILGIDIENLSREDVRKRIGVFLREEPFHRIATVNPEFLIEADRNPEFRDAIRSADLRVVDGFGIVLAGWFRGEHLRRFPGADLLFFVLAEAERERFPVFLAIRKDGLSPLSEIKQALLRTYPGLIVDGMELDASSEGVRCEPLDAKYKILLCTFGAPEQELFLASFHGRPTGVRLAIGIGGALDFLTGKQKRAPEWMRVTGLEWCFRLLLQPKRWKRIWNATALFPFKVFRESVRKKARS